MVVCQSGSPNKAGESFREGCCPWGGNDLIAWLLAMERVLGHEGASFSL